MRRLIRGVYVASIAMPLLISGVARAQQQAEQTHQAGKLLAQMHMMNEMVIKAARMAEQRAEREDVQDYATRLGVDHGFADEKVRTVAKQLNVDLEKVVKNLKTKMQSTDAPSQTGKKKQQGAGEQKPLQAMKMLDQKLKRLRELEAGKFDVQFVRVMEMAHQTAVQNLTAARGRIEAEPLQHLLSDLIPILEQHVALAHSLQQEART